MARMRTFGIMTLLAVLLASFAFVASRGGSPEVTDEPPRYIEGREKEPVSQVGQGGTARLAFPVSMRPECLNVFLPGCRGAESLSNLVFEGPLALAPSGEYRPALATNLPSYGDGTLSIDPMTIELRLRENAAFSDGESVTSEDVKWTYQRASELAAEGKVSPPYYGFDRLETVEINGPKTVTLTFEEPYSEWQDLLTAPVFPAHVYRDRDFTKLSLDSNPIGSGPFLLTDLTKDAVSFSANARYWRERLEFPRLDGMEIEYEGPARAGRSLSSGRTDFGLFTQPGAAPDSGGLLRSKTSGERTELLVFNSKTIDDESRRALSEALDRDLVSESAGAKSADSIFPATGPADSPERDEGDSGEEEAGISSSGSLRIVYPAGGPLRDRAADSVAKQFEDTGLSVEVRRVAPGEYFSDTLPSGDFEVSLVAFDSLAEYESLTPLLPEDSARAVAASLAETEERDLYLSRTQSIISEEDALLALYIWPDSYAWSSTLSGPEPETPRQAVLWNASEWGFFK